MRALNSAPPPVLLDCSGNMIDMPMSGTSSLTERFFIIILWLHFAKTDLTNHIMPVVPPCFPSIAISAWLLAR